MDLNGLENFAHQLPEAAIDHFIKQGSQVRQIGDGVNRIMPSGHTGGMAYRFYKHHIYNAKKSEEQGMEVYDDVDMIQWLKSRRSKPVEQVRFLPESLLKWNRAGELIGGRLKADYEAWQRGESAHGTPLIKWGLLSSGQVATLNSEGIFTVEQFAEKPFEQIQGKYSQTIADSHKRAKLFVAKQANDEKVQEQLAQFAKVEEEKKALEARVAKLEALLEDKTAPVAKSAGPIIEAKKNK